MFAGNEVIDTTARKSNDTVLFQRMKKFIEEGEQNIGLEEIVKQINCESQMYAVFLKKCQVIADENKDAMKSRKTMGEKGLFILEELAKSEAYFSEKQNGELLNLFEPEP